MSNSVTEEHDNLANLSTTIVTSVSANDGNHKRYLPVSINGKMKIGMLIDSGSDLTIIDFITASRLHLSFKLLQRLSPRILGANNTSIDMVGMIRNG